MNVIIKNKTHSLIELAHDTNNLIVCHSREEAHRVHLEAIALEKNIHQPITYNDMLQRRYSSRNIDELLIDNISFFIKHVSNSKCNTFTMNKNIYNSIKKD